MVTAFIVWDINPIIASWGELSLRYYNLLWALGLLLGYWLLLRFARAEGTPVRVMDRVALYASVGVILGARLGHCLFYDPLYYLANPLEVLEVWKGGLASHGGAIGVLIGIFLACRKERIPMLWVLDRLVIPIALIAAMIRMGNLMNSEIYGHPTELPWGMVFVRAGETLPRHPTQIYEALTYLVVFAALMLLYYRRPALRARRGLIFAIFLVVMFAARILIEFLKEVQSSFEEGWCLDMGQLLSLPFLCYGVGLLVWALRRGPAEEPRFADERAKAPKRQGR